MIKHLFTIAAIVLISFSSFAQSKGYQVTIKDDQQVIDQKTKDKLSAAFYNVYPWFASADGYRTKRSADLTFNSNATTDIKAKAGEIIVNSDWVKRKSQKKIEKQLRSAFTKKVINLLLSVKIHFLIRC
jgi:hypothetical protein